MQIFDGKVLQNQHIAIIERDNDISGIFMGKTDQILNRFGPRAAERQGILRRIKICNRGLTEPLLQNKQIPAMPAG